MGLGWGLHANPKREEREEGRSGRSELRIRRGQAVLQEGEQIALLVYEHRTNARTKWENAVLNFLSNEVIYAYSTQSRQLSLMDGDRPAAGSLKKRHIKETPEYEIVL